MRAALRVVLDTNVWLDWLVFADPGVARLRSAHAKGAVEVVIDEACEEELARVLGYELHARVLSAAAQAEALASARAIARPHAVARRDEFGAAPGETRAPAARLPACRDPDDQKFLELAFACGAGALLTKDNALLELERGVLPFRIIAPHNLKIS